ncbi:MAG TPA: ATP-binding protein [Candidatus Paceibacterota bacterium]
MEKKSKKEGEPRRIVYIMRGISGSGKSTLARKLAGTEGVIHSTDDYFVVNGEYVHDPSKTRENHERNKEAFIKSLAEGKPIVIVDNTNAQRFEYEPYLDLAEQYGYEVIFKEMPMPNPSEAVKRNIHKVPEDTVKRQIQNWEESITG